MANEAVPTYEELVELYVQNFHVSGYTFLTLAGLLDSEESGSDVVLSFIDSEFQDDMLAPRWDGRTLEDYASGVIDPQTLDPATAGPRRYMGYLQELWDEVRTTDPHAQDAQR